MAKREGGQLWPIPKQTVGKHLVLRNYLRGWLPILGRYQSRLLFIDGFAGPGEYAGGEPGSPVIAMECVEEVRAAGRLANVEVVCLFMESNERTAKHLRQVLDTRFSGSETVYGVLAGPFEDNVAEILDRLEGEGKKLAPAFVMVDPFGVKGVRMEFIQRILQHEKSECMISFMYEAINRHKGTTEFHDHLDALFATDDWRRSLNIGDSQACKSFLQDMFRQQLKRHGAGHVVPFELWDGNRHVYTVFFTSGSATGCNLMKESMWSVDRHGGYRFRGQPLHGPDLLDLFGLNEVKEPLGRELKEAFGDQWTLIDDIEDFVMGDRTSFCRNQLRRKTLAPLEKERRIEVRRPQGGQGFPRGRGIEVRFL